jgi:dCMP deaminase
MNPLEWLTLVLVLITGYYAVQTRLTVGEMRAARGAQVLPKLVAGFRVVGPLVMYPRVANIGPGTALDIECKLKLEPNGQEWRWRWALLASGESQEFSPSAPHPDGTPFQPYIEQFEKHYTHFSLDAVYRDAMGKRHTSSSRAEIRETIRLAKGGGVHPIVEPVERVEKQLERGVKEIEGLRRVFESRLVLGGFPTVRSEPPSTGSRRVYMAEPRPSVEEYKMALAVEVASRSNCVKSHVGAIILIDDRIRAVGYNGTIEGYLDCFEGGCERCRDMSLGSGEQLDRCVCVHAEENALISAARFGIEVEKAHCYVTHEPCLGCTKLLIQARIAKVVYLKTYEYPEETGQNKSREAIRDHSRREHESGKVGTVFEQFDQALPPVEGWKKRLDEMKRSALAFAKAAGHLRGEPKGTS